MTVIDRAEFASEAWVRFVDQELNALFAQAAGLLAGQSLAICQVLIDAPPHLSRSARGELAWSITIADGVASALPVELHRADVKTRADYATMRVSARSIDGGSADARAQRVRLRQQAVAEGKVVEQGSLQGQSGAMLSLLVQLHDRMAQRTT